jgi:outer membrane protein TolC
MVLFTGCHPTQPFYMHDTGDLSHYLDRATELEYPDVAVESLPEATQAYAPLTVDNQDYEFRDISLEECIAIALNNTKLVRTLPGSNQNIGDIASQILASPSSQLTTALDPALVSSSANPQPMVIDSNGNRTLARGAVRANQVGGVEDALSEFDAQYSSFLSYNKTDRARNVGPGSPFNPQQFQADDVTYQSAISKRMATGGVATMRSQTIYGLNNIPAPGLGRQFPADYTQILEAQIQQPLLRGRGALVNRIPVVLARINEDISLHQFEERIRNITKDVENAYWDLYFSYWNVETSKIAYNASLDVWRTVEPRYKLGEVAVTAEAQAKSQVHQFEAQLKLALYGANLPGADPGVFGRERALRYLMGLSPTDGRLLRPTDDPMTARMEFDWWSVQGEALLRNVDLRQQKWLIKERELELVSAKNQILPDVNVTALYRWLGVGNSLSRRSGGNAPFPAGPASAFEELLGGNYQEGSVRLEFTPNAFGARRQLALIRNSQLQLAREVEVLREKEIALMYNLSESINLMNSHYLQTQIKMNQWAASEIDASSWLDVLEKGENTSGQGLPQILDNVLRAQQRRAQAQQEYYRALVEYNKSIVRVHQLKGSLLEYNNIAMEEGPWAEKAYWDAMGNARERSAGVPLPYGASRPSVFSKGPVQQHTGDTNPAQPSPLNPASNLGPKKDEAEPVTPEPVSEPEEDVPAGKSIETLPPRSVNVSQPSRVVRTVSSQTNQTRR